MTDSSLPFMLGNSVLLPCPALDAADRMSILALYIIAAQKRLVSPMSPPVWPCAGVSLLLPAKLVLDHYLHPSPTPQTASTPSATAAPNCPCQCGACAAKSCRTVADPQAGLKEMVNLAPSHPANLLPRTFCPVRIVIIIVDQAWAGRAAALACSSSFDHQHDCQ